MRHTLLVVVLVVLAGCAGPAATPPTEDSEPTPTSSAVDAADGVPCDESLHLSFYRFAGQGWNRSTVRVGYQLPADSAFLLVAYVDGAPAGSRLVSNDGGGPVASDGTPIDLDRSSEGEHTLEVVFHLDRNGNGAFDENRDPPCLNGGVVVRAGPERVNFDRPD